MAEKRTAAGAKTESRLGLVPPARSAEKAAARPRTPRPPKPRFRLTRRATILLLAVCAVVVTIAYPLQEYLAQRSQLAAIQARNSTLTSRVTSLQQQIALWNDPGYVAIQARARLHYVLPGEEGFTLPGTTIGSEQLGMPTPSASPWYDTLWGTVKSPGAAPSGGSTGR
ncbi:MAG TPA: septum formation initiator family protein [Actinospica sp.]|nr:septum formation initiator family protein [Actinospica sp.]